MKRLLPLLLAYVFLTTQGWALSGGPVFGGGDAGVTIGTYAGVLLPTGDETSTTTGAATTTIGNSLGLFSLGIPQIALASGAFVYFTEGRTYVGTIVGVADPDELTFRGLVKAQFNIDINAAAIINGDGSVTNITFSFPAGYANGSIDCEIAPGGLSGVNSALALATRIEGTASLSVQDADVNTGQPVGVISSLNLMVDGFKQSPTADVSADLAAFGLSQQVTNSGGGTTGG